MKSNPVKQLETLGQSVWLDYIRRDLIASGGLRRLIRDDGLRGITSNPSIFEKAIVESHVYDKDIRTLALTGKGPKEIYEALSQRDVQSAADEFLTLYETTDGGDGYVSLEVSPHLAYDTNGTIQEARRLWRALNRPNVFIKVPATVEGLPAIQHLVGEGININVTLLFGLPRYREVAAAYLTGIDQLVRRGKSPERVASVASFFLSRIDTLVDPMLEAKMKDAGPAAEQARRLRGQAAIASARIAYQICKEIFGSPLFEKLKAKGARPQRVLWASTSTKNPEYSDVKYVEPLIGAGTINTLPMETLDAYRDHGNPQVRLEQEVDQARDALKRLPELGIDMDAVAQQLEDEGVDKFNKPYDKLIEALTRKADSWREPRLARR